jgi:hypothetical protein
MSRVTTKGTPGIDYPIIGYMRASDIVASKVQRPLTPKRLQSILESDYNVQLSRPVVVRPNEDGTYRHIEGQLTLAKFIQHNEQNARIQVQIITIPEDELSDADAIIALNNTTKFSNSQKTSARIRDEAPDAMAVVSTLQEYDMTINLQGAIKVHAFGIAVGTQLIEFYNRYGRRRLYDLLEMLWDLFSSPDGQSVEQDIRKDVKILKSFVQLYDEYTHVEIYNGMAETEWTAADILSEASMRAENASSGSLETHVYKVLKSLIEEEKS